MKGSSIPLLQAEISWKSPMNRLPSVHSLALAGDGPCQAKWGVFSPVHNFGNTKGLVPQANCYNTGGQIVACLQVMSLHRLKSMAVKQWGRFHPSQSPAGRCYWEHYSATWQIPQDRTIRLYSVYLRQFPHRLRRPSLLHCWKIHNHNLATRRRFSTLPWLEGRSKIPLGPRLTYGVIR